MGKLERAKAGLPALHIFRLDITSEDEARAAVDWLTNRLGGVVIVTASYTPTLRWQIKSLEADGPCSYISRSPPGQCVQNLCKISSKRNFTLNVLPSPTG